MSLEAWGDEGDMDHFGFVTEGRAEEMFRAGLQAMREMLARFVEQGGHPDGPVIANSMRLNWNPSWGPDPGKPDVIIDDCWDARTSSPSDNRADLPPEVSRSELMSDRHFDS